MLEIGGSKISPPFPPPPPAAVVVVEGGEVLLQLLEIGGSTSSPCHPPPPPPAAAAVAAVAAHGYCCCCCSPPEKGRIVMNFLYTHTQTHKHTLPLASLAVDDCPENPKLQHKSAVAAADHHHQGNQ